MPLAGVMVTPPFLALFSGELATDCSMAFALAQESAESTSSKKLANCGVAPPGGAHTHDFKYVGVMCVPAATWTPTTALTWAAVRSAQASEGGAAVDGGAVAAVRMKM